MIQTHGEWEKTLAIVGSYFQIVLDGDPDFDCVSQGHQAQKEHACRMPDNFKTTWLYIGALC